ncbi:MAG: hypothetical protein IIC07_06225, partial [Proteobacteria bacterium]|nr:hypothetical protein [Pseudomonadota bacterium]
MLAHQIGVLLIPVVLELGKIFKELAGAGSINDVVAAFGNFLPKAIAFTADVVILMSRAWVGWKLVIVTITGLISSFVGVVLGSLAKALSTITAGILVMSDVLIGMGKMSAETGNKIRDMQVTLENLATDGFDFATGSIALMTEEIGETLSAQRDLEDRLEAVKDRLVGVAVATNQARQATVLATVATKSLVDQIGKLPPVLKVSEDAIEKLRIANLAWGSAVGAGTDVNETLLDTLLNSPEPRARRAAEDVKYMWTLEGQLGAAPAMANMAHAAKPRLDTIDDYLKQEKSPEPKMVGDTFEVHIQTLKEQMKYDRKEFTVEAGMK